MMTEKTRLLITKMFVLIFVVSLGLFVIPENAHAISPSGEKKSFSQKAFEFFFEGFVGAIDIRSTAMSATQTVLVEAPSFAISNRPFDGMVNCAVKPYGVNLNFPDGAIDPNDDCSDMYASGVTGTYAGPTQNKAQGSIVGIAMALEDVALNEPPPMNLAYYARREVSDIPIIENTAYAQGNLGDDFLLKTIYDVWERMRNIAYGLLALFMLVIGIMIMVRHKVNPQTVVTIQQAVPKIIISVILITFSYPIIALAIALILPLSGLALAIVGPAENTTMLVGLLALAALPLITLTGVGLAIMILYIITVLVAVFFMVKLIVTIFASYLKLVTAMMTGPFVFAWGAIPGNEKALTNWFKQVGVNVIVVPLMIGGLRLIQYVVDTLAKETLKASAGSLADTNGFLSIAVSEGGKNSAGVLFLIPILVIILLVKFGKIPNQVEDAVFGRRR